MTKVVLDMVALILEGIEGLVFDLPARPPGLYQLHNIFFAHLKIGDPTVVVGDFSVN